MIGSQRGRKAYVAALFAAATQTAIPNLATRKRGIRRTSTSTRCHGKRPVHLLLPCWHLGDIASLYIIETRLMHHRYGHMILALDSRQKVQLL